MAYSDQFPLSLYIHVPFCTTKCSYCAFNTYTHIEHLIDPFIDALQREIRWVGQRNNRRRVHTVFFGGGTPSLLRAAQFGALFDAVRDSFDLQQDAEITLEANPNDITVEYARELGDVGFNRVSLGMQTAHAGELSLFRRRHNNDAVALAVSAFRRAGFDSLNLDLIYGFPHQTLESWSDSLQQAIALKPDHLSLYGLSLEDGTPMKTWVMRGQLPAPDDDLAADMYEHACVQLAGRGYDQYEISNWALPGNACRHNLQYWNNYSYVGVGPGAHGYAGGYRYATLLSPQRYIKAMASNVEDDQPGYPWTPAVETFTQVERDVEISETLIMGLRLIDVGIDRREFAERFGEDVVAIHQDAFAKFAHAGLIAIEPELIKLTDRGKLLSNIVFRELV